MLFVIITADIVIYIGAQKNLKFLFPVICFFSFLFRTKIHFVIVGGWLVEFLKNKPFHRMLLKKIVAIYPETKLMVKQMKENYGFENIYQLHNFRMVDIRSVEYKSEARDGAINLVFMARVHPMKGVDTVFRLAKSLQEEGLYQVKIDIYGPVFEGYKKFFYNKLSQCHAVVSYKGVLSPEDINDILSGYDAMLFPTRYFTEGFPGSILDSYMAGVPVVATRWKYAEEYVPVSAGATSNFDDVEDFISKVRFIIGAPETLRSMRVGALEEAEKYTSNAAWDVSSYFCKIKI